MTNRRLVGGRVGRQVAVSRVVRIWSVVRSLFGDLPLKVERDIGYLIADLDDVDNGRDG